MFAETPKQKLVAKAVYNLALYAQDLCNNSTLSIDDKMKTVQWLSKKYQEVNRLLMQIKTEEINKK